MGQVRGIERTRQRHLLCARKGLRLTVSRHGPDERYREDYGQGHSSENTKDLAGTPYAGGEMWGLGRFSREALMLLPVGRHG